MTTDSSSKRPTGKQYVLFYASGRIGNYEDREGEATFQVIFYRTVHRIWTCNKLDYVDPEPEKDLAKSPGRFVLERKGVSYINLDLVEEVHES